MFAMLNRFVGIRKGYRLLRTAACLTTVLIASMSGLEAQSPSPALGNKFPLYAATIQDNAIYKIDSAGNQTLLTSNGYIHILPQEFLTGILAVDTAGNVYISCYDFDNNGPGVIVKVDPQGQQTLFASSQTTNSLVGLPLGLAFDPAGNLYVANFSLSGGSSNILRIAPDGTQSIFAPNTGTSMFFIYVALDSAGNVYGLGFDPSQGFSMAIWKISPDGASQTLFSSLGIGLPTSLAIGSWPFQGLGNGPFLISYYDLNTGTMTVASMGAGGFPSGTPLSLGSLPAVFAFDANKNLYVDLWTSGSVAGMVYKFDTAGNTTPLAQTNVAATSLAFTPSASTYNFSGFLAPIAGPPAVNTGKAGRTYAIKWQLKDSTGAFVTSLSAIRSITYGSVACSSFTGDPTSAVDTTATGGSALRYDSTANQFVYNWASPSTAGCYNVYLTLSSGQVFPVQFKLQ
jgi:hypothetical protein